MKHFLGVEYIRFFLFVAGMLGAGFVNASGGFIDSENSSGAGQATFSLVPATGTYRSQEEFTLELRLNTEKAVTSAKAYLSFDPKVFSVVRIEKGTTLFYWWESEAIDGMIKLSASAPAPGVSGQIAIANIIIKGRQSGGSKIGYDQSSIVLDAADQDILNIASSTGGNFSFAPGAESDSIDKDTPKKSFGNFLGILLGLLGVLVVGVVLYIVWRKMQGGNQAPQ